MIKILYLVIISGFANCVCFGQTPRSFTGKVFDAETKLPISYATILLKNKNQGTYTNLQGEFNLSYQTNDTVFITLLGYDGIYLALRIHENKDSIFLKKSNIILKEITIRAENPQTLIPKKAKQKVYQEWIGYAKSKYRGDYMSFRQAATWIHNTYAKTLKVSKVRCYINNHKERLFFEDGKSVFRNIKKEKIIVRLNIFSMNSTNSPSDENLLNDNIILEIKEKQEEIDFDLENYDLYLPPIGFYVCLEMIGIIKEGVFISLERLTKEDFRQFSVKFTKTENPNSFVKTWANTWISTQQATFKFGVEIEVPQ